jgi:hypothetical protein
VQPDATIQGRPKPAAEPPGQPLAMPALGEQIDQPRRCDHRGQQIAQIENDTHGISEADSGQTGCTIGQKRKFRWRRPTCPRAGGPPAVGTLAADAHAGHEPRLANASLPPALNGHNPGPGRPLRSRFLEGGTVAARYGTCPALAEAENLQAQQRHRPYRDPRPMITREPWRTPGKLPGRTRPHPRLRTPPARRHGCLSTS